MIKQDETRKLDYIDCGKSLKTLYLHLYLYFSFIIFKMLFFIFWPLPEKLFDCPKKNYFARLWGLQSPQPPADTPMSLLTASTAVDRVVTGCTKFITRW